MSPSTPKESKSRDGGSQLTTNPTAGARSIRTSTLFLLVAADVIIAASMLASAISFVLRPDPAVKAGPMYVVLALMTVASVLMAVLALNATFVPMLNRRQVADVSLVMWAMAATGTVTGILTLGGAVNSLVLRIFVASMAWVFIWSQSARIARARAAQAAGRPAGARTASSATARSASPKPRSRQKRGGRKH